MHVAAGGVTGGAGVTNHLATADAGPITHGAPRHVAQGDVVGVAVNVTEVDIQADTAGNRIPVGGYPSRRRVLGLVTVSSKVCTGVALGGAGNRVDAVTKGTSHHPGRGDGVANIAAA